MRCSVELRTGHALLCSTAHSRICRHSAMRRSVTVRRSKTPGNIVEGLRSSDDVRNSYFASALVVDVSLVHRGEVDDVPIVSSSFAFGCCVGSHTTILPVPDESYLLCSAVPLLKDACRKLLWHCPPHAVVEFDLGQQLTQK